MLTRIQSLMVLPLLFFGLACGQSTSTVPNARSSASGKGASEFVPEGSPTASSFENNVYKNFFFNFSLTVPDGWSVADRQTEELMMDVGASAFAGDDKNLERDLKDSFDTTYQLLTLSEYEIGKSIPSNTTLMVLAERVGDIAQIADSKAYLENTAQLMERSAIPVEIEKECYPIEVGGRNAYCLDLKMGPEGHQADQSYIAIKVDAFYLSFVLTGNSEAQKTTLNQIIDSVVFE